MVCDNRKFFSVQVIFKYSLDQTTARSSSSLTMYLSLQEIKNQDVNAIGFYLSAVNCSSAAPRQEQDA